MLVVLTGSRAVADDAGGFRAETKARQPGSLVVADGGRLLLVGNHRSGSISTIDLSAERVAAETTVGRSLSAMAAVPGGDRLVALDPDSRALILLDRRGTEIREIARAETPADPFRVAVSPDGKTVVVASRWTRSLGLFRIPGEKPAIEAVRTVEMPFSPGELVFLSDGPSLVVADAFGGSIATVDPVSGAIGEVRGLPAHNIRGMAVSPDGRTLALVHQTLHRQARSTFDDVHWGSLLSNHLRLVRVTDLKTAGPLNARVVDLDEVAHAAGDPSAVAFAPDGRTVVALGGVGEAAIVAPPGHPLRRFEVGRRPSAVALSPDGKMAYFADPDADSVATVSTEGGTNRKRVTLGPRPEPSAVERGERLFRDARLSHHGWLSCASCHTDGHTIGGLADTLGDGSYGAPKLVPSLFGVKSTGPWGWLGNLPDLGTQVKKSVETTMRGDSPDEAKVADLVAYLDSLELPVARPTVDPSAASRGKAIFKARDCARCHSGDALTSEGQYDVGLDDQAGNRKFNPPSLRGAGLRDRFLHDGRAGSIEDVFRVQKHPDGRSMSSDEIRDLAAFLRTL